MAVAGHALRARRALAHLPEHDPALAMLALWCRHRDGETTGTRGVTICYGPDFEALPLREQIGVLGHHVLHVALRHSARMAAMARREGDAFSHQGFNLAADALVNATLTAAGHALPRPAVTLATLAETVLDDHETRLADWDAERLYLRLARTGGSGAENRQSYARAYDFRPDLDRETDDTSQAADWQGHLTRALDAGRRAGRGIGLVAGQLGDLPLRPTPWEAHLRGLLAPALSRVPRRSHARPARAWLAADSHARRAGGPVPAFQPGALRDARRPRVAVGLDTSGSIGDTVLRRFAGELAGIVRRSGAETHLLGFDDTVHTEARLDPGALEQALAALTVRRGGGTDFTEVLARARALGASAAVILTDLDGGFGPSPGLPVIWAVSAPCGPTPPFGRLLDLGG
ncbi:MAG: VWA-like domain-containing protein [Rhodobacteraceae bacterium]|nr:VWA-like domain-containing protein [Paracoccaceae bacterium]